MFHQRFAAAFVGIVGLGAAAVAQPNVNGAHLNLRVFNDFPTSTLATNNAYPAQVQISDTNLTGSGFANRHTWHFSDDGGATDATFLNAHRFSFSADVRASGTGAGEVGLQLSPWWSLQADGQFMMNTTTGEVACFGGRLPFYSFTAAQAVHYTLGQTIRLGIEYDPHSLTAGDPGQIRYSYGALNSGWLNFDQGNPGEDPPHGLWGILNPAAAGGYMQVVGATSLNGLVGTWSNITYIPSPGVGAVLGLAGLMAARRRRLDSPLSFHGVRRGGSTAAPVFSDARPGLTPGPGAPMM
jgi:hypothetical protein